MTSAAGGLHTFAMIIVTILHCAFFVFVFRLLCTPRLRSSFTLCVPGIVQNSRTGDL
jgi:hypothetical protein